MESRTNIFELKLTDRIKIIQQLLYLSGLSTEQATEATDSILKNAYLFTDVLINHKHFCWEIKHIEYCLLMTGLVATTNLDEIAVAKACTILGDVLKQISERKVVNDTLNQAYKKIVIDAFEKLTHAKDYYTQWKIVTLIVQFSKMIYSKDQKRIMDEGVAKLPKKDELVQILNRTNSSNCFQNIRCFLDFYNSSLEQPTIFSFHNSYKNNLAEQSSQVQRSYIEFNVNTLQISMLTSSKSVNTNLPEKTVLMTLHNSIVIPNKNDPNKFTITSENVKTISTREEPFPGPPKVIINFSPTNKPAFKMNVFPWFDRKQPMNRAFVNVTATLPVNDNYTTLKRPRSSESDEDSVMIKKEGPELKKGREEENQSTNLQQNKFTFETVTQQSDQSFRRASIVEIVTVNHKSCQQSKPRTELMEHQNDDTHDGSSIDSYIAYFAYFKKITMTNSLETMVTKELSAVNISLTEIRDDIISSSENQKMKVREAAKKFCNSRLAEQSKFKKHIELLCQLKQSQIEMQASFEESQASLEGFMEALNEENEEKRHGEEKINNLMEQGMQKLFQCKQVVWNSQLDQLSDTIEKYRQL